jgi:protein O-GlcNAc transferase
LGALCLPSDGSSSGQLLQPRYEDALFVCEFVQSQVLNANGELLTDVPPAQRHRVQNILYTNGSLRYVLDRPDSRSSAITLHLKALDLLMRPSKPQGDSEGYNAVDVVVSVCVAGLLASVGPNTPLASELARALGISDSSRFSSRMLEQSFHVLDAVHNAGPGLIDTLLRMGGGLLPMTLLLPDQVSRLPSLLFPSYAGVLPGLCDKPIQDDPEIVSHPDAPHARRMTSTVLLTLARIFQHASTTSHLTLSIKGTPVRTSTSLVLLFYYLALAIYPCPATCNNMGIILSTVSVSTLTTDSNGQQEVVNGQVLAKAYYRKGLIQDNSHPHLLTNLGSLLKDQGKIDEAIQCVAYIICAVAVNSYA